MTQAGGGPRSTELRRRALRRIPGGVDSNVRLDAPQVFFERGEGAWLWDVDGKDYVDYLLGQGPNFLGHANAQVTSAVEQACRSGTLYGGQHPQEVEAAERLCSAIGWADMVRFGMTGTEMVQAGLRLARAATGRRRVVRFEGHYHGWIDNVLTKVVDGKAQPASAGQLADHLDDTFLLPWNNIDALAAVLGEHGTEIAAVLMEPAMFNSGAIEPRPGYLEQVKALCAGHGVVLIFDEVISGFRLALGGAAERYGVTPDLAVYGKAMAGGWPVAALAGRGQLMERFGTAEVNHSGTFNGSVMATAAVVATIALLERERPYERIAGYGATLQRGLLELARARDLPLRIQGPPMAFHMAFGDPSPIHDFRGLSGFDSARYARLAAALAESGLWVARRGIWYVSAAHGDRELAATMERVDQAMASGGAS
jgi:glutamate-1-semialdehyde 2,1-aminomutase